MTTDSPPGLSPVPSESLSQSLVSTAAEKSRSNLRTTTGAKESDGRSIKPILAGDSGDLLFVGSPLEGQGAAQTADPSLRSGDSGVPNPPRRGPGRPPTGKGQPAHARKHDDRPIKRKYKLGKDGTFKRRRRKRWTNNSPHARFRPSAVTQRDVEVIATATGAGLNQIQVARALQLHNSVVKRVLSDPSMQAFVAEARQEHRAKVLANVLSLSQDVWDRVKDAVDANESKAVVDYVKAAKDMEQMSASAAGELRPIVAVQSNTLNVDADLDEALALIDKMRGAKRAE